MTELIDKVREALIALAYQESVKLYHDPEFKEMLMPMLLGTAKKCAKMKVEEEDDLDDSNLDEQTQLMLEELEESIFGSEDQIRDMSFQQAKNSFTTKQEYIDNFEKELAEKFEDEEIYKEAEEFKEKIRNSFKDFLNKLQDSFDFADKLLSFLTEYARKEGIEKAITIERRNAAIRALIPSEEEYIASSLNNINAAKEYFKQIQAILD